MSSTHVVRHSPPARRPVALVPLVPTRPCPWPPGGPMPPMPSMPTAPVPIRAAPRGTHSSWAPHAGSQIWVGWDVLLEAPVACCAAARLIGTVASSMSSISTWPQRHVAAAAPTLGGGRAGEDMFTVQRVCSRIENPQLAEDYKYRGMVLPFLLSQSHGTAAANRTRRECAGQCDVLARREEGLAKLESVRKAACGQKTENFPPMSAS